MSLGRFRRQYDQLSPFERGRTIGMIIAGWTARQVNRQLRRFQCVVRRCWDQWIRKYHLDEDQAQEAFDRTIVQKTATS
ncbi:uncharacterized protein TNCV_2051441 [Trichonephila clavipes]|nr:uncharacterized protein TNCV_2051441 [Trichonephila clavipes]